MNTPVAEPPGYCPRCGYRMGPGTCPECGSVVTPKSLSRRSPAQRRRRKILIGLVLGIGTLGACGWYAWEKFDLFHYLSTERLLSLKGAPNSAITNELVKRHNAS